MSYEKGYKIWSDAVIQDMMNRYSISFIEAIWKVEQFKLWQRFKKDQEKFMMIAAKDMAILIYWATPKLFPKKGYS